MQAATIRAFDRVAHLLPPGRRRAERVRALRLPPGPVMHPSAQLGFWMLRPIQFLEHCRARYGTTFSLQLPGFPPIVNFADEAANKELFTGPPEELFAGRANESLRPVVGGGSLLLLDGERHLRERRLLLPPFHGARLSAYGVTIRDITRRELARAVIGQPAAIQPVMQHITLDVILRTVFGVDEGADLIELRAAILELLDGASAMTIVPSLQIDLGPRSPWGRFRERRAHVDDLLYRLIATRRRDAERSPDRAEGPPETGPLNSVASARRTPPAADDILSLMLEARYEDGSAMSDRDLRDELMTLLAAGHETSATALAWAFARLGRHPEVLARAHEEVDRVLGGGAPDDAVTKAELPYVDAVIKETMRIHPVVYAVGRVLQKSRSIGGWDVPAGHAAILSIWLTHHDPTMWPDPERFDPERFLGTRPGPGNKVTPYTYFPFGGGVRRCIGMAFALYEMRIVLAEALRQFRVAAEGELTAVRRTVTMAPVHGGVVTLRRR